MIREGLAGKRVALSGVTGFLGTALFERLLTDIDVARIDCIARGDATDRIAGLLNGSAFGPARERLGEARLRELFDQKVSPVAADLAAGDPTLASDLDLVIHCAATVSFDPPIDEAFATNLLGSTRLYRAAAGIPFIHVSTAYVAGMTRGMQAEAPLDRAVDWRAEADIAIRMRPEVEDESRRPERLDGFVARARAKVGRAGPQSIAAEAESLRREWVTRRLVEMGRARARSLGWPDVYAYTKALTEKALDEIAGEAPLTIVRPSIIESAWERPFPGWIEGFRVADPVILAYGRGVLPEFPGIADGVVDLIPVDMVANAILAVAAREPEHRAIYHVSSGSRNPLRFRELYEMTREYFLRHPLPERGRGTYKVPEWTFPGSRAVARKLRGAERVVETAEWLVGRLPRNGRAREAARQVDRMRGRLDFVKRYAALFGAYAEVEVIYTDERARELWEALPEQDRLDFGFDPTAVDWQRYLQEVHLPAVSAPMRWIAATPARTPPTVAIQPANGNGNGHRPVLAVFDIEGTIADSNVVEAYMWLRLAETGGAARARTVASIAAKIPGFLNAERRDRGEFLRRFYKEYTGASVAEVRRLAEEHMADLFLRRLAPAAVRRIRKHRDAGHRIVFITGALDVLVAPLGRLADVVVAARLSERDGVFTGDIERPPLVGEARASWLSAYAREHGADLAASYAYADSMSDLPLLQAVGNPVAVNPDVALARIARKQRWPIEDWPSGRGAPRFLIPAEPVP